MTRREWTIIAMGAACGFCVAYSAASIVILLIEAAR